MKTVIYILTALFVMNITILSAGNPKIIIVKVNVKTDKIFLHEAALAPVTPKEAFFNDVEPRPLAEINRLTPIPSNEATFINIKTEVNIEPVNPNLLQKLVPETPKEAEFEDTATEPISGIVSIAPVAPIVAAFEE